jgi:putative SOS response-associated peptidase YedK
MCGRYRLNRGWERDLQGMLRFVNEKLDIDEDRLDVRPTDPMPVIRFVDGRLEVDIRRWGFLRLMPGASGKRVRKQLFNAKSETAPMLKTFKDAFQTDRCLIPLSSWYEWPERASGKQKVEIAARHHRTMLAAGICETSRSFDTGEPVKTFTMLTTTPTEFLGAVHDRAPLILPEQHYADWLEGDAAQAQALTGAPPESTAYDLRDVDEGKPQLDLL